MTSLPVLTRLGYDGARELPTSENKFHWLRWSNTAVMKRAHRTEQYKFLKERLNTITSDIPRDYSNARAENLWLLLPNLVGYSHSPGQK